MRAITYAGEKILTTDEIAELLVEMTAALAREGMAEAVRIPIVPTDGEPHAAADLVVGLGNDVLSVPQPWDGPEPDFGDDAAELRRHLGKYVPQAQGNDDGPAHQHADHFDYDFDFRSH